MDFLYYNDPKYCNKNGRQVFHMMVTIPFLVNIICIIIFIIIYNIGSFNSYIVDMSTSILMILLLTIIPTLSIIYLNYKVLGSIDNICILKGIELNEEDKQTFIDKNKKKE